MKNGDSVILAPEGGGGRAEKGYTRKNRQEALHIAQHLRPADTVSHDRPDGLRHPAGGWVGDWLASSNAVSRRGREKKKKRRSVCGIRPERSEDVLCNILRP